MTELSRVGEAVLAERIHSYQCHVTLPLGQTTLLLLLLQITAPTKKKITDKNKEQIREEGEHKPN